MKPLTSYPSYVTYFSSFQPIFFHIFGHYGPLNTGNPEPRSYGIKHDLCGKVISRFITWNLKPALQWNCFLSNVLHHFLLLSMGKHQLRRKLRVLLLSFLANWPTCIKLYFHQNPAVCKFDLHIYIPGCQQVGDWGWGIFTHFWKGDILIFASPPPHTHTLLQNPTRNFGHVFDSIPCNNSSRFNKIKLHTSSGIQSFPGPFRSSWNLPS